jgi:putative transposase
MARQLRIQYPGAYYHVTSRGNEQQDIYRDHADYKRFLITLSESLDIFNVSLLAYVCMTNHFHLFLSTPDGNLSEFMRHFNITYTSVFNRRHNRTGHLYQGRYKSFLVNADTYLKEVSRYIHLNPVRIEDHSGKSVEAKIKLLGQYRYSSEQPQLKVVRECWTPEELIKNFSQIRRKDDGEICQRGKNSTDRAILMEL